MYVSGSEAKLKVELWLQTRLGLNQNFPYVIRHVPSCHAMQVGKGEGEFFFKGKKKSRNGHLAKFYRLKIGAPERNKCLKLLTLLPYHIPTQSDGHTHHCQNMPLLSTETGFQPHRISDRVLRIHISQERFFIYLYLMPRFLMTPFLSHSSRFYFPGNFRFYSHLILLITFYLHESNSGSLNTGSVSNKNYVPIFLLCNQLNYSKA